MRASPIKGVGGRPRRAGRPLTPVHSKFPAALYRASKRAATGNVMPVTVWIRHQVVLALAERDKKSA